jgi:hypothetical protein
MEQLVPKRDVWIMVPRARWLPRTRYSFEVLVAAALIGLALGSLLAVARVSMSHSAADPAPAIR